MQNSIILVKFERKKLVETDLICETKNKVRVLHDCLKAVANRHKLYADFKRKDIKFQTGDKVLLKVPP